MLRRRKLNDSESEALLGSSRSEYTTGYFILMLLAGAAAIVGIVLGAVSVARLNDIQDPLFPIHLIGNLSLPTEPETFVCNFHQGGAFEISYQEGDGDFGFPNGTAPDSDVETGFHGVWDRYPNGTLYFGASGMRAGLNPICSLVDGDPFVIPPSNNTIWPGIWQCTVVTYGELTWNDEGKFYDGALMIGMEPAFDQRQDGATFVALSDVFGVNGFTLRGIDRPLQLYNDKLPRNFQGPLIEHPGFGPPPPPVN